MKEGDMTMEIEDTLPSGKLIKKEPENLKKTIELLTSEPQKFSSLMDFSIDIGKKSSKKRVFIDKVNNVHVQESDKKMEFESFLSCLLGKRNEDKFGYEDEYLALKDNEELSLNEESSSDNN